MMRKSLGRRTALDPSPLFKTIAYVLLGVWSFVVLFPLYWLVVTSFKTPIQVDSGPVYIPYVDYQPTLDAWRYIFVDLRNDTLRPYINTVVVGLISAVLALGLGGTAAYALVRFQYRPRLGAIGTFIGCVALVVVAIILRVPWQLAAVSGLALFVVLLQTVGRRFKRSL